MKSNRQLTDIVEAPLVGHVDDLVSLGVGAEGDTFQQHGRQGARRPPTVVKVDDSYLRDTKSLMSGRGGQRK